MSQKRSSKTQKRQRRHKRRASGRRPHDQLTAEAPELDLMVQLDLAIEEPHPLALLQLVSSLMAAVDPRRRNPFERAGPAAEEVSLDQLVGSFMEVDMPQTTAALSVVAALSADELEAARIGRELSSRVSARPGWLSRLTGITPYRAVEMGHVLGDGDDVLLGVRLPNGYEATALVYIDHNMGTLVKDAFLIAQPIDAVLEVMRTQADDPDTSFTDLDLGDARVRVEEAIRLGAITVPPCESDTWPGCRPLVEWLVRGLPAGGRGYERPEWNDRALGALSEEFFASSFGSALDDDDHRQLLESILWFGTDYGPGDPLRWSPVAVEILLDDWMPRKIVAEAPFLALAPDLLRGFIGFCHDRRGVRPEHTQETLAAVDEHEPDYQQIIRSPRLQGVEALMAAMGPADLDGADEGGLEGFADLAEQAFAALLDEWLLRQAGGRKALGALEPEPLADEPFDWSGVPADIHDRVHEVLTWCDGCCDAMLDAEYRTACRRLLAAIAAGDAGVFRRKGSAHTAAAAVCWSVGKANSLFDGSGIAVQDLTAYFGVGSSPSPRAATLLRAAGIQAQPAGEIALGSPDFLVSAQRERLIEMRDLYAGRLD